MAATLNTLLAMATGLSLFASQPPRWEPLETGLRVTYYGSRYVGGETTASGDPYATEGHIAALGPAQLAAVREHYAADPREVGAFPVLRCLDCDPDWWGYLVRVCDEGRSHCEVLRVVDTDGAALEVDLPDGTWLRYGYPAGQGVFTGTLEVLTWNPPLSAP